MVDWSGMDDCWETFSTQEIYMGFFCCWPSHEPKSDHTVDDDTVGNGGPVGAGNPLRSQSLASQIPSDAPRDNRDIPSERRRSVSKLRANLPSSTAEADAEFGPRLRPALIDGKNHKSAFKEAEIAPNGDVNPHPHPFIMLWGQGFDQEHRERLNRMKQESLAHEVTPKWIATPYGLGIARPKSDGKKMGHPTIAMAVQQAAVEAGLRGLLTEKDKKEPEAFFGGEVSKGVLLDNDTGRYVTLDEETTVTRLESMAANVFGPQLGWHVVPVFLSQSDTKEIRQISRNNTLENMQALREDS
ncbi:MAG: hypothetical protein ABW032_12200 [Burkholderiaceae bacterium]